jgi:ABC-type uncharacterized transport system permease subunit
MNVHTIQHVHLFFVGVSLLAVVLSLLFSFFYLIQQSQLKHKKNFTLLSRLPSLETLDHYVIRCLMVGAVSLSVLLVTGIYLAHMEWHNDWIHDQKFIVAICTWVWVLFTLFLRFKMGIRGGKFFYSILVGLVFLVVSCLVAWMV